MIRRYGVILIVSLIALGYVFILFSKIVQSAESLNATFLKAIYARDFSMMDKLIAGGVDINAPIRNDLTPLAEAAFAGDIEVVDYLLRKGANVEGTKKLPNSPIYFAIFKGNTAVVRRFLDLGITPNYTWPAGEGTGGTLLTAAVDSGHLEIVELLVRRGADVNFRGSGNYGALYRSIFSDYFDVFKFLLSKGACLNERDKAALSGWEKNKQNEKYIERLKDKKGCNDKVQPTLYPYYASENRVKQIKNNYSKIKIGMTLEQVKSLLGEPDEKLPVYEPKILNPKQTGNTHWFIIQRISDKGSTKDKDEKLVRISYDLNWKVIGIDHWGFDDKNR